MGRLEEIKLEEIQILNNRGDGEEKGDRDHREEDVEDLDRLLWISAAEPPRQVLNAFYFCVDKELKYEPFYMDFGPLNLGLTYKYVTELEKLLKDPTYVGKRIFHYTTLDEQKAANAAYLMGAFQVIVLHRTPEAAFEPFKAFKLPAFKDAGYAESTYKCTILDCLRGLAYAISLGWFDYRQFNLSEYQHYEKLENGDLNWIIPDKLIAFSSPAAKRKDAYGTAYFIPADYVPIFKKLKVGTVIRLNNKTYEANDFVKEGIGHQELFFADGTTPSPEIVNAFLEIVEKEQTAVAVHCKAGLGRTGTLIGCYAMKHFKFPAADFIGWIRIARPGSVLGPQQHFLIEQEKHLIPMSVNLKSKVRLYCSVVKSKPENEGVGDERTRKGYPPQWRHWSRRRTRRCQVETEDFLPRREEAIARRLQCPQERTSSERSREKSDRASYLELIYHFYYHLSLECYLSLLCRCYFYYLSCVTLIIV